LPAADITVREVRKDPTKLKKLPKPILREVKDKLRQLAEL
jgi:hypothetical protein